MRQPYSDVKLFQCVVSPPQPTVERPTPSTIRYQKMVLENGTRLNTGMSSMLDTQTTIRIQFIGKGNIDAHVNGGTTKGPSLGSETRAFCSLAVMRRRFLV